MEVFILSLAEKLIYHFWNTSEVKVFIVKMLRKYARETDNEVDDIIVSVIESKLLK